MDKLHDLDENQRKILIKNRLLKKSESNLLQNPYKKADIKELKTEDSEK